MDSIVVKKERLLEKLRENMALHDEIYEEAYKNYWETVSSKFESEVREYRRKIKNKEFDNDAVSISIYINAPQNNKESYEQAIGMLEWTEDSEIKLSSREFERYVRNNWEWKDSFKMSNTMYMTTGSMGKFDNF